jgi:hypothetical protein
MFARVMHAEDGSTLSLSRNSEFPKSGYGFGVISITPGSGDLETRESCGRRERNQPLLMSCRLAESGRDRESSRVRNLEKHWGKCRTKQTGRRSWTSACICKSWVFLISNPVIQLPDPNSALAHRKFSGYHRRLITQRFSREKRIKTLRGGLVAVGKIGKDVSFLARYTAEQWPALTNFVPSVLHLHH